MLSSERIPNNVYLSDNKRLQRALERWQPKFLDWWKDMGPEGFQDAHKVYLRTAISADAKGWANFDYVRMPEYRWGIFLAEPEHERKIAFGDLMGRDVWQEVPGEFRNPLRRLIVTQGDTEPASVEQQRLLGQNCPSLYDLRNIFQVNVEEGRHLWAMVYLLHSYFGRDGRDEGDALLERTSGSEDKPRILSTFNEPITNWLDFYMFAMFTDRDGKYQLLALAESSFDPLSRTTRFMLTEEAHHMFVGETGIARIIERCCQLLQETSGMAEDVRRQGGIDLPTIQKHLNLWFTLSLDLFGGEISSNAASFFANGLKGRPHEMRFDDHVAKEGTYDVPVPENGHLKSEEVPLRNAMNEVNRDSYIEDCEKGLKRWNRVLEKFGMSDRLYLPNKRFNRHIGIYAGHHFDPQGHPISEEKWELHKDEWLPSAADKQYIESLQATPVFEPGKMANWIAPPRRGINGQPVDFDYVRAEA
ncbi:MAG: benzoyl-CoA 2,3-epoxidase subunit BoxB [Gemmatimonadetes bacterium]|nr:benzoyl-CoA 2,3-epoxidase subunit BoxB [Gemmatimonadota bacterium]